MKWWAWLLLIIILILIISAIVKSASMNKGMGVDYAEVERRDITETVSASGKIFPETEVKISSDVSGEIVELNVIEGDSVQIGDVLAIIDPDLYESQVRRGQASLSSAHVQLAQARSAVQVAIAQKEQADAQLKNQQKIHNRNIELHEKGVISNAEFESSEISLETASAEYKSAVANLKSREDDVEAASYNIESADASLSELRTSLRKTTIHSPMNGVVSLLNVEKGERVVGTIQMSGDVLMRIADFGSIEARVEVSENDILNVSLGNEAEIEVEAYYGRTFKGKVTEIANSAANISSTTRTSLSNDEVTNFIVKIGVDEESYKTLIQEGKPFPFRPGMSCSVEIKTEQKENVLAVPLAAVTTREKENEGNNNIDEVVFRVQNDTAFQTIVNTGIQDRSYIEITSGISEGETIVSGPYSAVSRELENKMKVHKKEKSEPDK